MLLVPKELHTTLKGMSAFLTVKFANQTTNTTQTPKHVFAQLRLPSITDKNVWHVTFPSIGTMTQMSVNYAKELPSMTQLKRLAFPAKEQLQFLAKTN